MGIGGNQVDVEEDWRNSLGVRKRKSPGGVTKVGYRMALAVA